MGKNTIAQIPRDVGKALGFDRGTVKGISGHSWRRTAATLWRTVEA